MLAPCMSTGVETSRYVVVSPSYPRTLSCLRSLSVRLQLLVVHGDADKVSACCVYVLLDRVFVWAPQPHSVFAFADTFTTAYRISSMLPEAFMFKRGRVPDLSRFALLHGTSGHSGLQQCWSLRRLEPIPVYDRSLMQMSALYRFVSKRVDPFRFWLQAADMYRYLHGLGGRSGVLTGLGCGRSRRSRPQRSCLIRWRRRIRRSRHSRSVPDRSFFGTSRV